MCMHAESKEGEGDNENRNLKDFEREGTNRYWYMKCLEEETDKMTKTADAMLHSKVNKTEKRTARTLHA